MMMLFILILAAIPAAVILASLFRLLSLRQGGEVIATLQGGIEVPPDTDTLEGRRLLNIMEEISIASGVPVPRTFMLVNEWGINAFSAGYSPADAVITVTRGAVKHLNRNELQAMLAHEFSHVLNGDMRANVRLIGGLFGMTILWHAGRRIISSIVLRAHVIFLPLVLLGGVLVAISSIGVIGGRLFKAAFTRQRELLADASAVQFTRQADGLAGVLKKMAGLIAGSELKDPFRVEEISHMLFGEGKPPFSGSLRHIRRYCNAFNVWNRISISRTFTGFKRNGC